MHPDAKKAIPMSRKPIRLLVEKQNRKTSKREADAPCGLSFNQLMESLK